MKNFLLMFGLVACWSSSYGQLTAPFTETFSGTSAPTGWTNSNVSGSTSANTLWKFSTAPGWGVTGTADHTTGGGTNYAWNDGSTPEESGVMLMTDSIIMTGVINPGLEFFLTSNNVDFPGDNVTTDVEFYDGANWNYLGTYAGDNANWVQINIPLSGFTITGKCLVRWTTDQTAQNGDAFYNDILIDDVTVATAPACYFSGPAHANNVTNNAADIKWYSTEGTATLIYGLDGFNPATGGTVVNAVASPYALTSLTDDTKYEAYIVDTDCGSVNDTLPVAIFATLVNCPAPSNLVSTDTTGTTADFSWISGGSSAWVVEYGVVGFTLGTGTLLSASSNTNFSVTGLTAGTYYDVYVRDYCASFSDTSTNIGPVRVLTTCAPQTAPYANDFDSEADGLEAACWLQYSSVSNGYARVENLGSPNSGTQQLAIYSGTSSAGDTIAAISPQLSDLTAGDKQLRFFGKTSNVSTDLVIGTLSSSDLSTAIFTLLDTIKFASANVYEEIIYPVSLSNGYNGTDEYIVFVNTAGTTLDYIYIDDLNYELVPACTKVLSTSGSNITNVSFDLEFDGTGGTAFEYELGPTGFTQGTNAALISSISNDTVTVSSLNPLTTYDVYVRKDCGTSGVSVWDGPFTFTTLTNCVASTNFALSTDSVNETRAFFTWDAGQGNNYTVEWGVAGFTPLTNSGLGLVTVTDTFADITNLTATTTYDFYLIDSCGVFASTPVGPLSVTTPAPNTISTIGAYIDNNGSSAVSFEITTTAPINLTQITNVFNAGTTSSDVWIRQGGVANAPLTTGGDLIVDNASGWTLVQTTTVSGGGGGNSAPVPLQGFTPIFVPGSTTIGVVITGGMRYSGSGSTPLLPSGFTNGPVTLRAGGTVGGMLYGHGGTITNMGNQPRGFLGSIAYEIAVGGNCPDLFTNFAVDSISATAAKVNWVPGASNTSFYLEYGLTGFTPGSTAGTKITGTYPGAQPPVILTGLTAMTDYDFYFGEICNSGADSIYANGVQSFTTTVGCTPPSNADVSSISDTGVALLWDLSTSGGDYEVWFGARGFYQGSLTTGGIKTIVSVTTDSLYIDTLTSVTCYEFVVRSKCNPDSSDWIGPISFCTPCTPFNAPYSENFDGTTSPTLTPCWTAINNGSSTLSNVGVSTVQSQSPSNSMEIEYWTGSGELILVSPFFGDFDNLKRVRFSVWDDDNTSDLIVGTMSNPLDASTFTPFRTITAAEMDDQAWTDIRVFFGTYTGSDKYVAFSHGQNTTTDQFYIDDFVYEQPTCFDPTNFTFNGSTATSIDLSWTTGGATDWNIEYGPTGFTPGTGTRVNSTSSTNFIISSLPAGQIYDVYVRDSCAAGDVSLWTGPIVANTACTALSGTYTLGGITADYATFTDAANALNICGVSSAVTFNIQSGYYTDHLHLNGIPGLRRGVPGISATNTITFNGSGSDTLEWDGQGTQAAVWIDSVSHVTITNMYIINDAPSEGWGILITDNSDNINIINNTVFMDSTGVLRSDKSCINVSGNTENDLIAGASADDLTITGNTFYGGQNSVSLFGSGTARADFSQNVVFNNNQVYNFYTSGVYIRYYNGVEMNNNIIQSTNSAIDEDGFFLFDCDNYSFEENNIHVKDWGIYITDGNDGATVTTNSTVINNMVISENDYGLYLLDFESTDVWHNSVIGEPAIRINDQIDANIQNNIFTSTGDFAFESDDNLATGDVVNYNLYYSTGANPFDIGTGGVYADLAAWQTGDATNNVNSIEGDPIFASPSDLHVIGGLANDVGNNTLGITVDIDGDVRPATGSTVVDMGADEYIPVSGDFALKGAEFTKNGFCLRTNDTITLFAENIIGSASDLSVVPLVANYSVTGPINTTGTITLNTGIIALNDSAILRATNIDLSLPGEYTLNGYIVPNADNPLAVNDTLAFNSVTIKVDSILTVEPKSPTVLSATDTLVITARSPFFGGGDFHITEVSHYSTPTIAGVPLGGEPAWLVTDDYIEVTGVPGSDLAGYTLEQWNTALAGTYTFPSGTIMGPNGTAIFATGQLTTSVPSPSNFYYHANGTYAGTWSSTGAAGRILKDANGNIVDAVGYSGYTFPAGANVPASEWSGSMPASGNSWGVRLEGPDLNDPTGWVLSSTSPQDPNTINSGVIIPAPVSVTGFTWSTGGVTTSTASTDTVISSLLTPGTYNYIATFNSPCGIYIDTVVVIIPSCFAPTATSLLATAASATSASVNWDTTGLGSSTNYEIEYGPIGYTPGTGTSTPVAANNTGTITGLANNVCVDVYVRSACSATDFSPWAGPVKACPTTTPCDDLDGYQTLPINDNISSLIIPWQGAGGDAAISSTRSQSASNSLHILDLDGTGAQTSDIVAYFDTISNGAWDVSFSFYVETGAGAYYNIQQNHVATGATGTNLWGGDVYFDGSGTATVTYATPAIIAGTFTYAQGQWIDLNTVVDLDNDTIWIEYNGTSTGIGWDYSAYNGAASPQQFNGVNFYAGVYLTGTYNIDYYMDDFCVTPRAGVCPAPNTPTAANVDCDNFDVNFSSATGASLVQYGATGFTLGSGTYSGILTGASSFNVSGLTVGTSYDVYVANVCSSGDTSAFVGPLTVTAAGTAPVASFTTSVTGFTANFDGTASTGANLTYSWDYGDGSPAGSGATPSYTYATGGNFVVTLTVTNICGTDDTISSANSVSIDENPLARTVSVYPNPTSGMVNITFNSLGNASGTLRVLELSGKEVLRVQEDNINGEYTGQLDISKLATGVYMLEISSGDLKATRRLIKN